MAVLGVLGGGAVTRAELAERLSALEQMRNVGRARLKAAEDEVDEMRRAVAQAEGAIIETQMWIARVDRNGHGQEEAEQGDLPQA